MAFKSLSFFFTFYANQQTSRKSTSLQIMQIDPIHTILYFQSLVLCCCCWGCGNEGCSSLDEKLSCIHLDDKSCRSRGIWSKAWCGGNRELLLLYGLYITSHILLLRWPLLSSPLWSSSALCTASLFFLNNLESLSYLPGNHGTSTQKSLDAFAIGLGDSFSRTTGRKGLHCDISQGQLQAKSLWHQATSGAAWGQFACRSHRRVSLLPKDFLLVHTVRNLHFLSKNWTLISRENCRFFLGEKLVKMLWFWTS